MGSVADIKKSVTVHKMDSALEWASTHDHWQSLISSSNESVEYSVEADSTLIKNKKERECMRHKRELLEELESLLNRSNLISESDKKKRFTEAYTVSKTRLLIQELETNCGSRKRIYNRPVGHRKI